MIQEYLNRMKKEKGYLLKIYENGSVIGYLEPSVQQKLQPNIKITIQNEPNFE